MSGTNPTILDEENRRRVAPGGNDYSSLSRAGDDPHIRTVEDLRADIRGEIYADAAFVQAAAKQPELAQTEAEPQPDLPANRQPNATLNRAVGRAPGPGADTLFEYIADGKGRPILREQGQDPRADALATFKEATAAQNASYEAISNGTGSSGTARAALLVRDNAVRDYITADLGPAPALSDESALVAYQDRVVQSLDAVGLDHTAGIHPQEVAAEFGLDMSEAERRGLPFNETEALLNLADGPGLLETAVEYAARIAAAPAPILAQHIEVLSSNEAQSGITQQEAEILAVMRDAYTAQQPAPTMEEAPQPVNALEAMRAQIAETAQQDAGPTRDEVWSKAADEVAQAESARDQSAERLLGPAENGSAEARPLSVLEAMRHQIAAMKDQGGTEQDQGNDKGEGRADYVAAFRSFGGRGD